MSEDQNNKQNDNKDEHEVLRTFDMYRFFSRFDVILAIIFIVVVVALLFIMSLPPPAA